MGGIRLSAETKRQIDEARQSYIECKTLALDQAANCEPTAREAGEKAFEAFTAFTHTLREAYGPGWSISGSPENEAYRKALRQVEKIFSNKTQESGHLAEKSSADYLSRKHDLAPSGGGRRRF